MRNQLRNAAPTRLWKVEVHVCTVTFEFLEQLLCRGAQNFMDLIDLIQFVRAWK